MGTGPVPHALVAASSLQFARLRHPMVQIQATDFASAAILADGSVVTWGEPNYGGNSSQVQHQLKTVQQIQAASEAFAAILTDGSAVTWGNSPYGGNSDAVQDQRCSAH